MHGRVDLVEVVDTQNEIIKIQSDTIDVLYQQLCQLLPPDELVALPLYAMREAAELRKTIE